MTSRPPAPSVKGVGEYAHVVASVLLIAAPGCHVPVRSQSYSTVAGAAGDLHGSGLRTERSRVRNRDVPTPKAPAQDLPDSRD